MMFYRVHRSDCLKLDGCTCNRTWAPALALAHWTFTV